MKSQLIQTSKGKIVLLYLDKSGLSKKEMQFFVQEWIDKEDSISQKQLLHNSNGKPYLSGNSAPFISISYALDTVSIYFSDSDSVGIDIENISTKVNKVKSLFISDDEHLTFPNLNIETLHLIWGAKEAIYKLYDGDFKDLKNEVEVIHVDFESNEISTLSRFGNHICHFEILENQLVLVYC